MNNQLRKTLDRSVTVIAVARVSVHVRSFKKYYSNLIAYWKKDEISIPDRVKGQRVL